MNAVASSTARVSPSLAAARAFRSACTAAIAGRTRAASASRSAGAGASERLRHRVGHPDHRPRRRTRADADPSQHAGRHRGHLSSGGLVPGAHPVRPASGPDRAEERGAGSGWDSGGNTRSHAVDFQHDRMQTYRCQHASGGETTCTRRAPAGDPAPGPRGGAGRRGRAGRGVPGHRRDRPARPEGPRPAGAAAPGARRRHPGRAARLRARPRRARARGPDEKDRIAKAALAELPDRRHVHPRRGHHDRPAGRGPPARRRAHRRHPRLPLAARLADHPGITLHLVGGRVRHRTRAAVDAWALRAYGEINADVLFLATNGFSAERGLTTPDLAEAAVKRAVIARRPPGRAPRRLHQVRPGALRPLRRPDRRRPAHHRHRPRPATARRAVEAAGRTEVVRA